MTEHSHSTLVAGCFRCDLGRDEAMDAMADELAELRAQRDAVLALHQPQDVKHYTKVTAVHGGVPYPGPHDPFVVKQHCGMCDCGTDDWPCATVIALGGSDA